MSTQIVAAASPMARTAVAQAEGLMPSSGKRAALMRSARGATVLDVDLVAPGQFLTVLGGGKAGEAAFGAYYADYWREFS